MDSLAREGDRNLDVVIEENNESQDSFKTSSSDVDDKCDKNANYSNKPLLLFDNPKQAFQLNKTSSQSRNSQFK